MGWFKRRHRKAAQPGKSGGDSRVPLLKKFLRVLGIAILSLLALYYVGVNALLATSWGPKLMNLKPEMVRIHYSRAWTLVPLQLEVRGFRLSVQDRLVQLTVTAERVHGNLHLWTLARLRFDASRVEAEGVTMRLRPRMKKGDPREAHLDELPPIEGFDSPVLDQSANEVQPGEMPLLTVVLEDVTVHHLRELWIDRVRYTGDAEVSGGMRYVPFKRLRLDEVHFADAKSKLVAVEPHTVDLERIDARVNLEEIDLERFEFASLRGLDAEVQLSAAADPHFLNSYLRSVQGLSTLSLSGAAGPLDVAVKIERGVVLDGARLSFKAPRAAVRLPLVEVSGAATVHGEAAKGRLELDVTISQAVLRQHDGERLADAKAFSVGATSDADLTRLPEVAAVLALAGGRVKTFKSLNQFIPRGAGVHLEGGTGLLEGALQIDAASPRASGRLDLIGNDVTLKNRSATLEGRLLVHGEIRSLDLASGAMDLSGSTLALEDATLQAEGRTWPRLWLRAVADPCLVRPAGKVLWSTVISLGSSNLQPLLAIVSANVPLPGTLRLFSDSPNLRVQATLEVREDGVELPRLVLTSQSVRAEGALSLRERDSYGKVLEPWGGLVVHAGPLDVGVQFDGSKSSIVLTDLARWAQSRKLPPSANPVR